MTHVVKLVSLNTRKSQDLLCDLRLLYGLSAVVNVLLAISLGHSGLADVTTWSVSEVHRWMVEMLLTSEASGWCPAMS
jgi:hypothetical protein